MYGKAPRWLATFHQNRIVVNIVIGRTNEPSVFEVQIVLTNAVPTQFDNLFNPLRAAPPTLSPCSALVSSEL